jgi:hypothetical protein
VPWRISFPGDENRPAPCGEAAAGSSLTIAAPAPAREYIRERGTSHVHRKTTTLDLTTHRVVQFSETRRDLHCVAALPVLIEEAVDQWPVLLLAVRELVGRPAAATTEGRRTTWVRVCA